MQEAAQTWSQGGAEAVQRRCRGGTKKAREHKAVYSPEAQGLHGAKAGTRGHRETGAAEVTWSGGGACGLIIVPSCWVWSGGSSACPCVTAEGLIILKGAESGLALLG